MKEKMMTTSKKKALFATFELNEQIFESENKCQRGRTPSCRANPHRALFQNEEFQKSFSAQC